MYIKKEEFKAIEKALRLLPTGEEFCKLPVSDQATIVKAEFALMALEGRRIKSNRKTAEYIAEKRKINKNYAR